jgi:outer membrane protein assembly factor BamB
MGNCLARNGKPLLCLLFLGAVAHAEDWPQFHGPNRDGVSKETGLLARWGEKGPPLLWQKKAGEGFSGPVVADNKVLCFYRMNGKEVVDCRNAETGAEIWTSAYDCNYQDNYNKGDGPRSTPVIAAGKVFTLGAAGDLQCLDFSNGKVIWSRNINKDYHVPPTFFGVGATPVVEGDLLLVNVGGPRAGIVAFRIDTGKEVWTATNHEASYSSPVVATITGKRLAVFLTREGVVLLNPADGKIIHQQSWRARYDASVNAATPLVIGDLLFFSSSYETGALLLQYDGTQFKEMWKNDQSMSNHYNTCVYHDGHLYGIHGRQEAGAHLHCVALKTGKLKWKQPRFGCASLIVADGKLIALTEGGDLVLLQPTPAAFTEVSRAHVLDDTPTRAPAALANGRLYLRDDGKLICLNLKAEK